MSEENSKARDVAMGIVEDAIKSRASDIHFECFDKEACVRIRIDGTLKKVRSMPHDEYKAVCNAIKTMAGMDANETRLPQDGRVLHGTETESVLRVSTMPSTFGETLVMRIIPRSKEAFFGIERLGLSEEQIKLLKRWFSKPNGVILVSGPTGSGTTTTLYSVLNELNKESIKIISIEDPVEYAFNGIVQIQINPKVGLTFASAMRSSMRQDPDVLMVGEIRDLETLQIATQTALTGHLVLSTLHTSDATEGVIRIRDIGIEPFLINSMLIGIVSQRLVRNLCEHCRQEYTPEPSHMSSMGLKAEQYYRPKGCDRCSNIGYHGRTAIYEFFEMNHPARDLLLKGCNAEDLRSLAIREGMKTMWQDGLDKAARGLTSLEEIMRATGTD